MSLVNSGLMDRIASVEARFSSAAFDFVFALPFGFAELGAGSTRRGGGSPSEGEPGGEPARGGFDLVEDLVYPSRVAWWRGLFTVRSAGIVTVDVEH